MKARFIYTIILTVTGSFTLFEELFLRNYLFKHQKALIIADSLPNFLAVVLLVFVYMLVRPPAGDANLAKPVVAIVVGLVFYEVAQIWMPGRVFDWKDIVASGVGGVVCYGILWLVRDGSKLTKK